MPAAKITPEYSPVPTATPQRPETPRISIHVPEVRFSDAIGQAMAAQGRGFDSLSTATRAAAHSYDQLGNTFDKVGQEMWNRAVGLQQLENETKVNQATVEYGSYEAQQKMEINSLAGEAANSTVLAAKQKEWEAKRQELRTKLPPTSQGAFDSQSIHILGGMVNHAAAHFSTETKRAALGSNEAANALDIKRAIDSDSPEDVKVATDNIKKRFDDTIGPVKGWTKPEYEVAMKEVEQAILSPKLIKQAETNPELALKMLDENRGSFIDQKVYDHTRNTILDTQRMNTARIVGDAAQGNDPDATLAEVEAKAQKLAEERTDDIKTIEMAKTAARSKHAIANQDRREVKAKAWNTAQMATNGYGNPEGKIPKSYEDYIANGEEYKNAFQKLDEAQKNQLRHIWAKSAKGDFPETEATLGRYMELYGMHHTDPARFRDLILGMEEIPWARRIQLFEMQQKLIKEGIKLEGDPKTGHALNVLKNSGEMPKDMTPSHRKYNVFVGTYREGLIAKEKELGYARPLTAEEQINIGKIALEKVTNNRFFADTLRYQQLDEIKEVSKEWRDKYLSLFPGAAEEKMLNDYKGFLMNKAYNAKYGKPAAPVVTPPPAVSSGPKVNPNAR